MQFDLKVEIKRAWDWCWKYYCTPNEGFPPRQQWLSATDLERRIRAAVAGYDSSPDGWGSGVGIRGLGGVSLLHHCRNWLFNQVRRGFLRVDNFDKHTCSGARFRPVNVDLTEAEKKTNSVPRAERHRIIRHHKGADGRPACMANVPRQRFSFRRRPHWFTSIHAPQATCKKCLKLPQPVFAGEPNAKDS